MKKYKIVLSKSMIFATILFVFGGALLVSGIINKIHMNNCKSLDLIKFNEISAGDYVCGNIKSLLGRESNFDGKHVQKYGVKKNITPFVLIILKQSIFI